MTLSGKARAQDTREDKYICVQYICVQILYRDMEDIFIGGYEQHGDGVLSVSRSL